MSEIAPISRHNEEEAKDSLADKIREESVEARKKILIEGFVGKVATTVLPPKYTGWKTDFPVYLRQKAGGKDINGIRPNAKLTIIGGPETTHDSQTKGKEATHFWYKVRVDDDTQLNKKDYGTDNIGWVSAEFLQVNDGFKPIPLIEPGMGEKRSETETPTAENASDRPGFVLSPFTNTPKLIKAHGFKPGQKAICPYTNKVFLIPSDFIDTPTSPLPETPPTGEWHRNNVETADGNIGESNGDRAWNGRWIDPSFGTKENAPIQTSKIGDIIYFDNEGWITGEAGIAYFDGGTKTIQEYPVSGIGEITGIKKTGSKVFVLGEDGFAIFNKENKAVETHTEIGMIRNPADLGGDATIVGKKGTAELADGGDSYIFKPLDKIGEIISIEDYGYHMRAKEGVAYKKDDEWIQIPLTIGEIKYFGGVPEEGTRNIAFGEDGLAIIEEGKEPEEYKNLGEDYAVVLKKLTESNTEGRHGSFGSSKIENGMLVGQNYGSGNGEILSIILDKTKSEPFLKEVAIITEKIAEIDTNIAAEDFESAQKNVEEAEKMLGEGMMKDTSDLNPIKESLEEKIEERKKQLETKGSVEQTGDTYKVKFVDGKMIEHVPNSDMAEKLVQLGSGVWDWDKGGIQFDASGKFTSLETTLKGQFEKVRNFIQDDLKIDCSMLEIGKTSWIRIQDNNITKISTITENKIKGLNNLTQLEYLNAGFIAGGISLNELPNQMNILIGIIEGDSVEGKKLADIKVDGKKIDMSKLGDYIYIEGEVKKVSGTPPPAPTDGGDKPAPKPTDGGDKPAPKPTDGGDKPAPKPTDKPVGPETLGTFVRPGVVKSPYPPHIEFEPDRALEAGDPVAEPGGKNPFKLPDNYEQMPQVVADVVTAIKKEPEKTLMFLEDALVINEGEAYGITLAVLENCPKNITIDKIISTAKNIAPKMTGEIDRALNDYKKSHPDLFPPEPPDTSGDTMPGKEYIAGSLHFKIDKDAIKFDGKTIAKFEGKPEQNGITKLEFMTEALPEQIKTIIGNQSEITGLNIVNVLDKNIALDLNGNKKLTDIEASWENNLSTWKFPAIESNIKLGDTSFNVTETDGKWMMNGPTPTGSSSPAIGPYDITREEHTDTLQFTPKKLNSLVFNSEVENIPGIDSAYIRYILNSPENVDVVNGSPHSKFKIKKLGDAPESSGVDKPFDYIGNGKNGDYTLGHSSYERVVINSIKYERGSDELIINVTPDGSPPIDITYGK